MKSIVLSTTEAEYMALLEEKDAKAHLQAPSQGFQGFLVLLL